MGGRPNKEAEVVGSSILLLQERFKQLQKSKEIRKERQLLQLLPQPTGKIGMSFQSFGEAGFQDPLALGLNSNFYDIPFYEAMKSRQLSSKVVKGNFIEKPDVVDTSLRL